MVQVGTDGLLIRTNGGDTYLASSKAEALLVGQLDRANEMGYKQIDFLIHVIQVFRAQPVGSDTQRASIACGQGKVRTFEAGTRGDRHQVRVKNVAAWQADA